MEYTGEQIFLAGLTDGLNKTASAEAAPEGSVLAKLDANLSKVAEALETDDDGSDNRSLLQKLAEGGREEAGGGFAARTVPPKASFKDRIFGAARRAGGAAKGVAGHKGVQLGATGVGGLAAGAGIKALIDRIRAKKKKAKK